MSQAGERYRQNLSELWRSRAGNATADSEMESHRAGRRDGTDDYSGLRRLPDAKEADANSPNPTARVHAMKKPITARWTLGLKKLKAISIRQPWAWLIVTGYKVIENLIWSTNLRDHVQKQALMQEYLNGKIKLL